MTELGGNPEVKVLSRNLRGLGQSTSANPFRVLRCVIVEREAGPECNRHIGEDSFPLRTIVNYCEEAYKLYGRYQAGKIYAKFSPMVSYPTKIPHMDVDYR